LNILIDIVHPAHVHYYRNMAAELSQKGHAVFWTVRNIPVAKRLLQNYGFTYIELSAKSDKLIKKIWQQILFGLQLKKICKQKKIDIAIGTSASIIYLTYFSRVKTIMFDDDDDEVQPLVRKYVHPHMSSLLSPDVLIGKRKRRDTIFYPSYHELAYLHPNRFTPDKNVLEEFNIKEDETFFIMRFNVFKAHHDIGIKGLSIEQKLKLIELLKPHGRIFITTERNIEPELLEYQLKVEPEKIHHLMAFSSIFLGDSQTMTSEAAVLGVPSLRCNSFVGRIAYLDEEEHKYKLTFGFKPENFSSLILKLRELLAEKNRKQVFQKRREMLLKDKIDVTRFWVWFIENYPFSLSDVNSKNWSNFK